MTQTATTWERRRARWAEYKNAQRRPGGMSQLAGDESGIEAGTVAVVPPFGNEMEGFVASGIPPTATAQTATTFAMMLTGQDAKYLQEALKSAINALDNDPRADRETKMRLIEMCARIGYYAEAAL